MPVPRPLSFPLPTHLKPTSKHASTGPNRKDSTSRRSPQRVCPRAKSNATARTCRTTPSTSTACIAKRCGRTRCISAPTT
ncbi:hypothetical protein BCR44DRAFT_1438301 [Catenaria anguillulae PL171]|uniref:Uncharacterized protein n=1 Tax=Catenaria anguillulae PL171 TaxID=765915 RepID=A0A1Y2HFH8_9FUNG|nr:hypothetical protein BCR44DRAFT_1438301 [Catenaria anguillulae PL171]